MHPCKDTPTRLLANSSVNLPPKTFAFFVEILRERALVMSAANVYPEPPELAGVLQALRRSEVRVTAAFSQWVCDDVQVILQTAGGDGEDKRSNLSVGMNRVTISSSSSSCSSSSSILNPHSNIITMLLLSRCFWPPMRIRALVARALAKRLHAAITLQCTFRAKLARMSQKKLAETLPPALYRSQKCLVAVRLIQRTFISHRVRPPVDCRAKISKPTHIFGKNDTDFWFWQVRRPFACVFKCMTAGPKSIGRRCCPLAIFGAKCTGEQTIRSRKNARL